MSEETEEMECEELLEKALTKVLTAGQVFDFVGLDSGQVFDFVGSE